MKKNVLDLTDMKASFLDRVHELLGKGVSMQLISATTHHHDQGPPPPLYYFIHKAYNIINKKFSYASKVVSNDSSIHHLA